MTNLARLFFLLFFFSSLLGQCWSLSHLHLCDYRRPKLLLLWKYFKFFLLVTLSVVSCSRARSVCPSEHILAELWLLLCSQAQQKIESQMKSSFSLQNLISVNIIFFPRGHEQMYNIPLSLWQQDSIVFHRCGNTLPNSSASVPSDQTTNFQISLLFLEVWLCLALWLMSAEPCLRSLVLMRAVQSSLLSSTIISDSGLCRKALNQHVFLLEPTIRSLCVVFVFNSCFFFFFFHSLRLIIRRKAICKNVPNNS